MKIERLEKLHACSDAREYVKTQKSAIAAWENCQRGDWMLWLAKKLNVDDRKLTMAKYHCAAQVLHLMKNSRSLAAMAASLQYANGEISREQLNAAAAAAYAAAAYAAAADVAADAYAAAADAADVAAAVAAAYAADAAADAYAADAYAADVRQKSLQNSADICRKYLTEDVLATYKKLK
jgi:hypothetical protein